MTAQLQKDIDDHKIYLVRGKKIPPPSRYCFHCKRGFVILFSQLMKRKLLLLNLELVDFIKVTKN